MTDEKKVDPLQVVKAALPDVFGKPATLDDKKLVDAMYTARMLEALFKARNKLLTEVLTSRRASDLEKLTRDEPNLIVAGGSLPGFTATRIWQKRLDAERIEKEMGADWVEDHKKEIDFVQFKSIKPGGEEGG